MPQLNVRVSEEEVAVLKKVAETYRTSVTELVRAYIEHLEKGGTPIGYPATGVHAASE